MGGSQGTAGHSHCQPLWCVGGEGGMQEGEREGGGGERERGGGGGGWGRERERGGGGGGERERERVKGKREKALFSHVHTNRGQSVCGI